MVASIRTRVGAVRRILIQTLLAAAVVVPTTTVITFLVGGVRAIWIGLVGALIEVSLFAPALAMRSARAILACVGGGMLIGPSPIVTR